MFEERGEYDGALRGIRDQPGMGLRAAAPVSCRRPSRSGAIVQSAASARSGDAGGGGCCDPALALRVAELGSEEAACRTGAARAWCGLAGTLDDRRSAAAGGFEPATQAP